MLQQQKTTVNGLWERQEKKETDHTRVLDLIKVDRDVGQIEADI